MPSAVSTKTPRRRRSESKEDFRQSLIDSARELLASGGYEAVSIRKITAKVGVTPMAFYRYFDNKQQVVQWLWQQTFDELLGELNAALSATTEEPLARLRVFIDGYIDFWVRRRDSFAAVFLGMVNDPRVPALELNVLKNPLVAPLFALWDDTLRACLGDGPDAPRRARHLRDLCFCQASVLIHALAAVSPGVWADPAALRRDGVQALLETVRSAQERDACAA